MFFYKKVFYQPLMVSSINKSTLCSGSSDHSPSAPHSAAPHHAFLWATKCSLPSLQGSVLRYFPLPPADLGPDSLVLTQRKEEQTPQAAGGRSWARACRSGREGCRGGEPINQPVTRSSLGPSPTPYRASVPGPAAQRGPRKGRGEDRRLYCVAIKDVKMELTPFGGPSPGEVTHHRSQEQGLSAARTGRHGEAEGKGQPG